MELENLEARSDERGTLVEAFKLPKDGQVFYIIIKPGESRGNHYHLRKTETFLVIWGSAVMTVKDRATGDIMKAETNGNRPISIKVVPNNTHVITATSEGCIVMVWASEQFDEEDPDTYLEEV